MKKTNQQIANEYISKRLKSMIPDPEELQDFTSEPLSQDRKERICEMIVHATERLAQAIH